MVKTCCAPNCRNKSKTPGISFFCFPKAQDLRQEWIRRVNKANFHPTRHTVLCSDHFPSDCFLSESVPEFLQLIGLEQRPARRRLKNGALPSLFRLTGSGWEEGHAEEKEEEMREEEGMEEESDEEGQFVVHMDVAEEDTEAESGFEDVQNPSPHEDTPSHLFQPPQAPSPSLQGHTTPADHVDAQGDNNNNVNISYNNNNNNDDDDGFCVNRPRRRCRNHGYSDGDNWKKEEEESGEGCVKKEPQSGEDYPDRANIRGNTNNKGGAGDGRSDSGAETMVPERNEDDRGPRETRSGEEPLFTIESVRTLSRDDLSSLRDGDDEAQANSSPSLPDKDLGGSHPPSAKKRKSPHKTPPSGKSSPSTRQAGLPFPAAPHPPGPLLCRIDPAFCKFQPVFEVPFASSPTFFHRTADSMVADSANKVITRLAHIDADVNRSDVKTEDVNDGSAPLSFQSGSKPSCPVNSPKCLLPCCTGKSGTAASKAPHLKKELTDADYACVADRKSRDPVLPDPQRKACVGKFSPGEIPYRSTPVTIPRVSDKKGSVPCRGESTVAYRSESSVPYRSESSAPYRSEPILLRSNNPKGTIPYRSEPLRKLAPAVPPAMSVAERKDQPKKSGAKELTWTSAYPKACKHLHSGGSAAKTTGGGGKGMGTKTEGAQGGRSKSFSSKASSSSSSAAAKRKSSVLDLSSSHLSSVPVSLKSSAPDPSSTQNSNAGKISEGAIYIRRDHVMADLLDVFKHSAHRVHRATAFRLCHNVSAAPATSFPTPTPTLSGRGLADCIQDNWEKVEHKRLFSLFWEECMNVYFDGYLQKVPKADSQPAGSDVPYVLGKVLRHGLVLCGYWPVTLAPACAVTVFTGEKCSLDLFRHSLNKAMFEYEVQALQDLQDSAREGGARFQEVRQERRVAVVVEAYGGTQCQVPAVPEEVEAFVAELAAYYLYCQPFWWLREVRRGFLSITEHTRPDQDYLSSMTEGEVVDMYHTLLPTPRTLLLRLTYRQEEGKMAAQQRLKAFLERLLLRLSPKEMVQLLKLWSHADCLLDDSYHVHFPSSSSSSSSSGDFSKVLPIFRPAANTLVLGYAGSSSFEHFEVMFRELVKEAAAEK